MTQEEKQLLLKDLSVRLPYGVIMNTPHGDGHLCSINQTIFGNEYGINISATRRDYFNDEKLNFKPYLRPMSSMTEEERKEISILIRENRPSPYGIINNKGIDNLLFSVSVTSIVLIDWLNTHHFDYRGLIEKGLAIAVTKENNPYKE